MDDESKSPVGCQIAILAIVVIFAVYCCHRSPAVNSEGWREGYKFGTFLGNQAGKDSVRTLTHEEMQKLGDFLYVQKTGDDDADRKRQTLNKQEWKDGLESGYNETFEKAVGNDMGLHK